MKSKYALVSMVILLFQFTDIVAQNRKPRIERKLAAQEQINSLGNGVLFVEILDDSYLAKISSEEIRSKVIHRIDQHGLVVRNAFEKHYSFSDVKFFMSSEYERPEENNERANSFLNQNSEIQQYIDSELPFVIASFATTPSYEVKSYVSPNASATSEQNNNNQYKTYQNPRTGLFLTDSNWKDIEKPFPNYVRTPTIFLTQEEIDEAVIKLNKILTNYYNKVN